VKSLPEPIGVRWARAPGERRLGTGLGQPAAHRAEGAQPDRGTGARPGGGVAPAVGL